MKKQRDYAPLLLRVCAELGAGRISEAFIHDPGFQTDGLTDEASQHITINPQHQTVDTVIHEILHRLYPAWSEVYVRRTTSWLRNRMTEQDVQTVYAEYQKRVKKRKSVKRIEE